MKFKLDENLPVSSTAILTSAGHDVDTVTQEGLIGAPDQDVVAAATAAGQILISLDRGLGDIRAYPPGSHVGIIVLRLTDKSAAAAIKAVSDLAALTNPDSLALVGWRTTASEAPVPRRLRRWYRLDRNGYLQGSHRHYKLSQWNSTQGCGEDCWHSSDGG